jgi:oligopeptide/dipeptide ABC transporter ATP-binding protein
MTDAKKEPLLEVRELRTQFTTSHGVVKAVDGVSFKVAKGERLAIVGESGSGKSATALSVMRLIDESVGRVVGGEVRFQGRDLLALGEREMQDVRGGDIGIIYQDALAALHPLYSVGDQIVEAIRCHRDVSKKVAWAEATDLLGQVGIPDARARVHQFPHQFSGGMRQRALIAMALSCEPDLLIADEPTTALDVTIQAQIIDLLVLLADERDMAVILITHDLGLVAGFCDRVVVMYAGKAVETGTVEQIFYDSRHPYTWGLMDSISRWDEPRRDWFHAIPGSPPSLIDAPSGCSFHPRCPLMSEPDCPTITPALRTIAGEHASACHFAEEIRRDDTAGSGEQGVAHASGSP